MTDWNLIDRNLINASLINASLINPNLTNRSTTHRGIARWWIAARACFMRPRLCFGFQRVRNGRLLIVATHDPFRSDSP